MSSQSPHTVGTVLVRFLTAFAAVFAGFTLLPKLQRLWLADQLTPALATVELGQWGVMVAVSSLGALVTAGLAFWAGRRRLAAWESAAPQSGVLFGALAGTLAGLVQSVALASALWSTWLSLTYDLGLRDARAIGPLSATVVWWAVLAVTGLIAGAAAVGVLHFPWLASAPLPRVAAFAPIESGQLLGASGLPDDGSRLDLSSPGVPTPIPVRR